MERNALWRSVIDTKYGSMWGGGGVVGFIIMCRGHMGWSTEIYKGWDDFCCFIIFKVGDGSSIKFWHDPWCEGLPMEDNFLELYNIAKDKEASVAELLSYFSAENYHWNINFIRPV